MTSPESSESLPDLLAPLPAEVRAQVLEVRAALARSGYECYLVGGAVRDLLLGRPVGDLDFATNAHPEQVRRVFRKTIPTGLQHGTVTVLLPPSGSFEVTTYRAESQYSDGRHPDRVSYAKTLAEDLSRRDFTVNALAYDPGSRELVDQHGGRTDLAARLLRTIGRPTDRFFEDGLRPIRACRLVATLGFHLEAATEMALRQPEVHERTRLVAIERFTDEILKGFKQAPQVSRMIQALEQSGLLYLFFRDHPAPTTEACLRELDALPPRDTAVALRLALWWNDLGYNDPTRVERIGKFIKFPNKLTRDIDWLQRTLRFEQNPGAEAAEHEYRVRAFLSALKETYGVGGAELLESLRAHSLVGRVVDARLRTLREAPLIVRDLALHGQDLMELGLSGPAIGQAFRTLLEKVLRQPELNTREHLLAIVKGR